MKPLHCLLDENIALQNDVRCSKTTVLNWNSKKLTFMHQKDDLTAPSFVWFSKKSISQHILALWGLNMHQNSNFSLCWYFYYSNRETDKTRGKLKNRGENCHSLPPKNAKKGEMFKCTNTSPSASLRLTPCQFLKVFTYMEVFYGTLIAQKGTIFVNFWRHFVFF